MQSGQVMRHGGHGQDGQAQVSPKKSPKKTNTQTQNKSNTEKTNPNLKYLSGKNEGHLLPRVPGAMPPAAHAPVTHSISNTGAAGNGKSNAGRARKPDRNAP